MARFALDMRRCSGFAAAALVGAALVGAGAGSSALGAATTAAPQVSARAMSLCRSVPEIDQLVVTRVTANTTFGYTFPAVVTVTNAAQARRVARAACALPPINRGVLSCPISYGASYKLAFSVRGRGGAGETLEFNPTGCETLTGLGAIRGIGARQGFYRTLGDAMGLHDATRYTFIGAVIDPPAP
jgi:hypothetical protein